MNVLFVGATPKERAPRSGDPLDSALALALGRIEELEGRLAALEKALAKRPSRTRKTPE